MYAKSQADRELVCKGELSLLTEDVSVFSSNRKWRGRDSAQDCKVSIQTTLFRSPTHLQCRFMLRRVSAGVGSRPAIIGDRHDVTEDNELRVSRRHCPRDLGQLTTRKTWPSSPT